ncbi:hypothetical protein Ahy_A02g005162 isoform B [Arachis hypogaea]|uniref:Uncharacterized protein n=1 Tax=Arachis hypogaea TaxID=3818 RepID=A0A445E5X7_ARAHY|nr:hypothetical protein Ahy_A02g005162 isoform B [Arachis hypogaea]
MLVAFEGVIKASHALISPRDNKPKRTRRGDLTEAICYAFMAGPAAIIIGNGLALSSIVVVLKGDYSEPCAGPAAIVIENGLPLSWTVVVWKFFSSFSLTLSRSLIAVI